MCFCFSFRLQNESYKHFRDPLACAKSFRDIEIVSDAIKCSLQVSYVYFSIVFEVTMIFCIINMYKILLI